MHIAVNCLVVLKVLKACCSFADRPAFSPFQAIAEEMAELEHAWPPFPAFGATRVGLFDDRA